MAIRYGTYWNIREWEAFEKIACLNGTTETVLHIERFTSNYML